MQGSPYREPAEHEAPPEPRWFTRRGEAEDGPFTADEIACSLSVGRVRVLTPARAEGETDWHPLAVVAAFGPAVRGLRGVEAEGADDGPRLRSLDDDSKLDRFVLAVAGLFVVIVIVASCVFCAR